jgi:magnesium chelatase family protein
MAVARGWSVAVHGVEGRLVEVEAHLATGLPAFALVGLPDTALFEARDRVRAAITNSGESWPSRRVTVSLSPADLHKRGSAFDLVLAAVILAAAGVVPRGSLLDVVVLGELGLDGRVRGVRGVLPAVTAAAAAGIRRVVVPDPNVREARLVPEVAAVGVRSLRQLVAVLRGEPVPEEPPSRLPRRQRVVAVADARQVPDLIDVRGQQEARRALEVCAAGGHNLYLFGAPGVGKTMLAERLPGLLPPLERDASLEVTSIHSVAGLLPSETPLVTGAPFCSPHHSATTAAMVGGGSGDIRPGAVSLAHRGVLLLDEAPEFRAGVLDALRQPLESGEVVIARSGITARFPARFQLVLAANPCPCGQAASASAACSCSSSVRRRYLSRLTGPLLDRIDVQVMVDQPSRHDLLSSDLPESSKAVAERVLEARDRAARRLAGTPWRLNAEVPGRELRGRFRAAPGSWQPLEDALSHGTVTARGIDRVLRVAWTLADLAGRDRPSRDDVSTALAYRKGIAKGAVGGDR